MRARHREVRLFLGLQPDALNLAAAADVCGFKVLELSPGHARLRCGLSLSSWGENIEVSLSAVDGNLMVDVLSESRVPIQIEDPSMNVKNTRRLFDALQAQLRDDEVIERVPFCASCGYLLAGIQQLECPECGSKTHDWASKPRRFGQMIRYAAVIAVVLIVAEIGLVFLLAVFGSLPETRAVLANVGVVRLFILNFLGFLAVLWAIKAWQSNK